MLNLTAEDVRQWIAANPVESKTIFESTPGSLAPPAGPTQQILRANTLSRQASTNNEPLSRTNSFFQLVESASSSNPLHSPKLFFEIAKTVYSSLDLGTVITTVLSIAVRIVVAERCSVFLVDEEKNELYSTAWDVGKDSIPGSSAIPKAIINRLSALAADRDHTPAVSRDPSEIIEMDDYDDPEITESIVENPGFRFPIGTGIAGHVAATGKGLNVEDAYSDSRFNKDFDIKTGFRTRNILCMPILGGPTSTEHPRGKVLGVASLINKVGEGSFTQDDIATFREFLFLVGIAVYNSILFKVAKEKEIEAVLEAQKFKALLESARALYAEDNTSDLCKKIITHARDLTRADQASCFLVDNEAKNLYSTVFDSSSGRGKYVFPMSKGIAGFVASTGTPLNLKNAYDDPRFNSEVDKATGYRTRSLLSTPIFGPNNDVIGVTNLVNKRDAGSGAVTFFTAEDQNVFEGFSSFCGLALRKTQLLEEITRSQKKLEVAMELMSFHAVAHSEDVPTLYSSVASLSPVTVEQMRSNDFDPHDFHVNDNRLVKMVVDMCQDLGFTARYSIHTDRLSLYVLTIRKNYRNVAYHNFTHAVSVVHGIYMLASSGHFKSHGLSDLEAFSMFIAALNHDIDHRGTNNQFQQNAHTALANFYSTSTMERHHFNHAMTILSAPGQSILDHLEESDYKRCMQLIEHAILATDLSLYFKSRAAVVALSSGKYNPTLTEHRDLLLGISMTCSDLAAQYKPFPKSKRTANSVYSEFFIQGDEEKRLHLNYTSELTNRENEFKIPQMQVAFFDGIVIPALQALTSVVDGTRLLLEQAEQNRHSWKELCEADIPYKIDTQKDI